MEQISPKYMMTLINNIKSELTKQYSNSDIRTYLTRWIEYYGTFNQNFGISIYDNGDLDLDTTINNIDDETLLKIAIDLDLETPDYIPSIPVFKNEVKASYQTASKALERAFKNIEKEPDSAIALANAALESIIKEILKDERLFDKTYNPKDTLGKLIEKCLKKFNTFPSSYMNDQNVKQLGSGLISCCQAIENLRSTQTLTAHGKTDSDFIIDDSSTAYFIVNAISTIGLFLLKQYQKLYPQNNTNEESDELPF